jgi:hypothetical protein
MTPTPEQPKTPLDEQIRHYARRHNLMDEDVEFMIGLLAAAFERGREEEREAWKELALQQTLHRARETTEGATDA